LKLGKHSYFLPLPFLRQWGNYFITQSTYNNSNPSKANKVNKWKLLYRNIARYNDLK
jgi:hypothetical protein